MHSAKLSVNINQPSITTIIQESVLKLEEIAKLAGVSKATVSSVLNGKAEKYRISKNTQQRVKEIVHKYGYQPNHSAAALRRGISHSIGFIVPDFENRSYLRIAKRLEALARKAGFQLIIASSDDDQETEIQTARLLVARGVDALLVSSCLKTDALVYQQFLNQGTPVIALDRPLPGNFCNVISDDRLGAFVLTNSLKLDLVKNAVLLGAMPELEISRLREQGFREALQAHLHIRGQAFYGKLYDADTGAETLRQACTATGAMPDAIITTSFNLLEGVIESIQNSPDKPVIDDDYPVQLATFGNSRLLDFLPIRINSLPQQYELIAEAAWKLAKQAIDNHYLPEQIIINRTLKRRNSLTDYKPASTEITACLT
jgi:LacI family fructose operon transcriptional repressor